MVKKILICSMCFMLLFGVCISAQREMPQGNPPSNMEMFQGNPPSGMQRPQGTPPEGMELPEGVAPPQVMLEDIQGFPGGGQGQRPQGNTDTAQTENEPMTFMGFVKEYQTPIISVVLLLLAFVFVKLYKGKNY